MLSRDNASHFYGLSTTTCIMQHEKTLKFLDRAAFAGCVCVALGGNISFEALSVCMNESLIKWAILVPREINLTRLKSAPNTAHALVRLEAMRERKKKKLAGNYVVKMAEGKKNRNIQNWLICEWIMATKPSILSASHWECETSWRFMERHWYEFSLVRLRAHISILFRDCKRNGIWIL